jgi:transposase
MSKRIPIKPILRLLSLNISSNEIARIRHISKNSIKAVSSIAKEKNLTYADIKDLESNQLYQDFFPGKDNGESIYKKVDYQYIHKELEKKGVYLNLLWMEYKDKCEENDELAVGYAKFCRDYHGFRTENSLVNHLIHKPGISIETDWSGPTMKIYDSLGKVIKVYLFVATLPYSQYTYVEPCLNMKEKSWLLCNIHMYEFFGGVTPQTICDNLKTGVTKHPKEGEILLNEDYECLARYYVTAILPCGVRKPRHKASVEGNVGNIATAIIAKLRNQEFSDFEELQAAVKEKLDDFNTAPFEKREGSRKEIFLREEKPKLHPLPENRYDLGIWVYKRKINKASYVTYNKNFYSCPHQYIGKYVDLKVSENTISIFLKDNRIQCHKLFLSTVTNKTRTDPKDFPSYFATVINDVESIRKRALDIGKPVLVAIDQILDCERIKEQGFLACKSVLGLQKQYGKERLFYACQYALEKQQVPKYRLLKSILSNNRDIILKEKEHQTYTNEGKVDSEEENIGYSRGDDYYKTKSDDIDKVGEKND